MGGSTTPHPRSEIARSRLRLRSLSVRRKRWQRHVGIRGVAGEAEANEVGVEVDGVDLAALLAAWGASGVTSDINGDGTVDGTDLAALLAAWGPVLP